ncbi:ABC-type antimicrobial peptide transport system, permease component [Chitinophaga eiseniae]|uniref:ABC-type antimicrobial peptide transport system, permease component n=1 Tax=Chitinophaga eiseniae TaxID=634771 RepID=A0A1T4U6I6_9BACT|nr:ABC transporter permease [Chitinophaga eiseniae]SKA48304.1 ABC-type antimicrobial peptide transport system, permease component [Chitinophaga eiseniae]
MILNYFKVAWRGLKRRKVYAMVNTLCLSLGTACTVLIFMLTHYHLSFDTFHTKSDRIYRVVTEFHQGAVTSTPSVPSPLGKAFRSDYAFAEKVARTATYSNRLITLRGDGNNRKFQEETGVAFAEPEFFDVMDFPLVQGNKQVVFSEPGCAVITERLAKKYFRDESPLGKVIRLDNKQDFRITGVLRDLPLNTDLRQEIYLTYSDLKQYDPWLGSDDSWEGVSSGMFCYVLLKPQVTAEKVNAALASMSTKYYNARDAQVFKFHLQPIADMHFNPELGGYVEKKNLWALVIVGVFLLVTACVNFINLATAQAVNRSREIGVRKALGSNRAQLFWQFITETAIVTALSVVLAFIIVYFTVPYFNRLFGLRISANVFQNAYLLILLPLLLVIVTFAAGSYPGVVLAGFQPVVALKGKITYRSAGGALLRKGLVITQFSISQLLVIGMLVVTSQMRYTRKADMGFAKEGVLMLSIPEKDKVKISTMRTELSQLANVKKVSFCFEAPAGPVNYATEIRFGSRQENENFDINMKAADNFYVPMFGLQVLEGRNLYPSDTAHEFLLNETTVKRLNAGAPRDMVGKKVTIDGVDGVIVGVVKDFHNQSFYTAIDPICITSSVKRYNNCAVLVNLDNLPSVLASLEKVWTGLYPDYVFKYEFLDERIGRFYKIDDMMLRLIQIFALIANFISCLGLYGLVSFMAVQKNREIGVRKVMGATTGNIMWLFGKEFLKLLIISFVPITPVAAWVMSSWLNNFMYRIHFGPGTFILALLLTLLIAALTSGYRTLRSALTHPLKSLRSE